MSYLSRLSSALESVGLRDPGVLVVEDDREVADVYSVWLEDAGFDVDVAHAGVEALKKVGEDVDVLLLDRKMAGGLSGDQVAEVLRSDDLQEITARRFDGEMPYVGVTAESWEMDFSFDTAKKLTPEMVRNLQRDDVDLQICMVTAVKPDIDVLDIDFDHYIVKDVDRSELEETVEALAKLSQLDDVQRRYQRLRLKRKVVEDKFSEERLVHDDRYKKLLEVMEEIEMHAGRRVESIKEVPLPGNQV